VLLKLYKAPFPTGKKPGSAFCVARSPERPLAPKSYCATIIFACALLPPYKAPRQGKKPALERH